MKWKELKWWEKVLETFFGGCAGCKFEDMPHEMAKSFTHTNQEPTTPCPEPESRQ